MNSPCIVLFEVVRWRIQEVTIRLLAMEEYGGKMQRLTHARWLTPIPFGGRFVET